MFSCNIGTLFVSFLCMKNNKRIILLISLLASLCSISGCSNSIDSSLPIDITSEDISESSNIHEDPSGNSINDSISEQNKDFEGIVFKNKTFTYDGKIHRVEVENLPEFANVSYVNNDQIEIGTYTVKAIISAKGYNETTLKAKLIIEAIEFKGLKFEDQTFEYDEKPHSIYVENLPDFASVTYTNNNQIYEGVYTVSAKVSAKNYKSVTLTARMTIAKMMPLIDIGDRTLIYNGDNQLVRIEFPNLPYRTTYSYKVDGKTVESENDLRVKTIGTHTVSVTLSNDYYDYLPRTSTAIINKNTNKG